MHVSLFIPCFVDQLYPQTAFNMIKVLKKAGCTVHYNAEQTCCGQPAYNAGYWDECRSVAEKFVRDFSENEYIVAPSGSCIGFVRNYYGKVLENNGHEKEMHHQQLPVYEFTEFLTTVLNVEDLGAEFKASAVYHDACGALRECGIKDAPRKLLRHVKGLQLIEAPDCEVCCGFGGTFAVKFEPISIGMGEQKVLNAIEMGAEYIISTDLSCLLHLDGYIRKHKLALKTIHIADVLSATLA
ncbi:(Fe-S)-binding protein [Agriterribacter sp.]|uniref:(Fe-S)-binding protein n=1 Tax=Agriterribacter sp. TaxID=2821509 RepID=UPI002D17F849|nr:(Fe-S)-binding protein [Agriterribacter sp.]HRO45741.1 (Fe-S)-binding protein [Agriterribacter sp.]HRQ15781.1 (Fe-S)-binding protein [Agriterribacter sp.]